MMKSNNPLNIETINIILIFVGFALFTTFVNSGIGSVVYRAVALLIGLYCLYKNTDYTKLVKRNRSLKLFLIIYAVLTIRMVYEMYFGVDAYTPYKDSRNLLMLFTFGIGWIPFLGALNSYTKIRKTALILSLFWVLLLILAIGLINKNANTGDLGRVSLNARQSTLAFGDNGAFLCIISACILFFFNKLPRFYKYVAPLGIVLGLYSAMIAGSRGPFISACVGLMYVFFNLKGKKKTLFILTGAIAICGGVVGSDIIEKISPTMANRIQMTIEDGDTSGRDVLFEAALNKIDENPFGYNPIILEPGGSFTGYHNVYLGTGVGTGIIGFILFIGLILSLLFRSLYSKIRKLNIFNFTIMSLFWFYCCRGITGVGLLTNTMFCVLVAYTCIILNSKTVK